MLETLRNAFKIKDIRKKIIFTFLMLIVIRIGSCLPIPGVDSDVFANWFANQGGDAIKLLDWLVERETFYTVEIHTANPVGRANMESVLARYWGEEYW